MDTPLETSCFTKKNPNLKRSSCSNQCENQIDLLAYETGEMGKLIQNFDWSKTPIGLANTWPQSLITMLRTILSSCYPMWLAWGKELTLFYNDAYAKMTLGQKHPGALGQSFPEVWSEIWTEVAPLTESVLCSGQATWNEGLLLFLERNGFPEETYHTFFYSPIFDDHAQIGGILCVVTEDTERNIGERRLRTLRELAAHTHEKTSSVEETCHTIVRVLENNPNDIPFSLLYLLNDEKDQVLLKGFSGIEPCGSLSPLSIDLIESDTLWPFSTIMKSGQGVIISNPLGKLTFPGGPWPEPSPQAIALPLAKPGQAKFAGFLVVGVSARRPLNDAYRGFFDLIAVQISIAITNIRIYEEERRRTEALAELDRAKTAFFANVSHEFRTPLTLMLGPIKEMWDKSRQQEQSETSHLLECVHRNGLRLQRLVNTLLDFSKIEAGRALASFEPTGITVFTEDLASTFRSVCEKAGLNLLIDCDPFDQMVFLDRDMWEKIVLNLLSNAFKFTLKGQVSVTLRQLDQHAELRVIDTGIGIAVEEMPRLFERFHRIENTKGRAYEGSGIGLALISELVKLHKGSIVAESNLGQGTAFIVRLPLGRSHLPNEQIRIEKSASPINAKAYQFVEGALHWLPDASNFHFSEIDHDIIVSPAIAEKKDSARILVVDDNADMRKYLMRLLSPRYQVDTVSNGKAALELVTKRPPDLIVSDAMMPIIDGFGLLKALRAESKTANIPVIILSARAGEESRIEGMQSGANEYLVKPFSARVLLASVSAQLQIARFRQEAQEAMGKSEERFRALLSATSEAVYQMSSDWSEMRYLQGREFIADMIQPSKTWFDKYVHPDDQQEVQQAIKKAIQSKGIFELEHRIFAVDGTLRWIHSRAIPIFNKNGDIVEWFGAASDVSRRKEAEQILLETSRHKDEFLATLAHELRNPLVPLLNALEVMRQAKMNVHSVEKAHAIMERQIVHMNRLIDDLLDLSRINHGKIRLQVEQIELAQAIQHSIESIAPIIAAAQHTLQVDLPSFPIFIAADITRLAQVFSNLLHNSSKYTQKGGVIRLSAKLHKNKVMISVVDNGIGIPSHMLHHIFEKFIQVDKSFEHSYGGLGIGLSLVKQLVELHHGKVKAKSKGKNLGSEFIVTLPTISSSTRIKNCSDELLAFPLPLRILVVDDNVDITESLAMILELMGHSIRTAGNGVEAIEIASVFHPDLIFMDIGMPRLNGYESARQILEKPFAKDIVLVALTGWGQEKDCRHAQEAGFHFHITKPIHYNALKKLFAEIKFVPTTI